VKDGVFKFEGQLIFPCQKDTMSLINPADSAQFHQVGFGNDEGTCFNMAVPVSAWTKERRLESVATKLIFLIFDFHQDALEKRLVIIIGVAKALLRMRRSSS
jgi:hypothetical protein